MLSVWLRAIRIKFLLASVIAVSLGLSLSWYAGYSIDMGPSLGINYRIFFNDKHYAKVEIGVGKGKKEFDKRETIKSRDVDKEIKRLLKR